MSNVSEEGGRKLGPDEKGITNKYFVELEFSNDMTLLLSKGKTRTSNIVFPNDKKFKLFFVSITDKLAASDPYSYEIRVKLDNEEIFARSIVEPPPRRRPAPDAPPPPSSRVLITPEQKAASEKRKQEEMARINNYAVGEVRPTTKKLPTEYKNGTMARHSSMTPSTSSSTGTEMIGFSIDRLSDPHNKVFLIRVPIGVGIHRLAIQVRQIQKSKIGKILKNMDPDIYYVNFMRKGTTFRIDSEITAQQPPLVYSIN